MYLVGQGSEGVYHEPSWCILFIIANQEREFNFPVSVMWEGSPQIIICLNNLFPLLPMAVLSILLIEK